jgi:hypothetical protein
MLMFWLLLQMSFMFYCKFFSPILRTNSAWCPSFPELTSDELTKLFIVVFLATAFYIAQAISPLDLHSLG